MRAKEYIACSEASLKHPAEIRQIIDEMLPLRSSRQQTVDYYNRKLIADIRLQACLLQKELYEKNNAMQTAEPEEFQMKEGEIPVEIAASVRDELFDVIKEDKTFGYLYFLLGNLRNSQRPPYAPKTSISGYNLFVSAYHGFAKLGNEHVSSPRRKGYFPVFALDFLCASVLDGSHLLLRFRNQGIQHHESVVHEAVVSLLYG